MRVFVSVDMEGVAGVATYDQVIRGGTGYPRAQQLMTEEANAAIRGALAGGAAEVLVNDSHGTMDNLIHDRLDRRARIVFGAPRPSCMVQGIRAGDAIAIFVGYHAAAGADGVLAHTFSSNFTEVRVNGQPVTEAEVNGLHAASLGVPVGVVTGDDQICAVAAKAFPGVSTVEVKQAHGFSATDTLHPHEARERIETAVRTAVEGVGELRAQPMPEQLRLEVDFAQLLAADMAATAPGSLRLASRTVHAEPRDVQELIGYIMTWYYLSAVAAQQTAGLIHRR
jgi:D-amino peptidase